MANFNKILLLGNLTRDPQLFYLPSGTMVVEFGLAINRKYKGQDGDLKNDTCFIDCKAYGKPAENINKYCKKGNPLFIEGRLTFNSWTAKDGSKHSKHRVTVERFQLLGVPNKVENNGGENIAVSDPVANSENELNDDIPF